MPYSWTHYQNESSTYALGRCCHVKWRFLEHLLLSFWLAIHQNFCTMCYEQQYTLLLLLKVKTGKNKERKNWAQQGVGRVHDLLLGLSTRRECKCFVLYLKKSQHYHWLEINGESSDNVEQGVQGVFVSIADNVIHSRYWKVDPNRAIDKSFKITNCI